jgi:hypothetical protein
MHRETTEAGEFRNPGWPQYRSMSLLNKELWDGLSGCAEVCEHVDRPKKLKQSKVTIALHEAAMIATKHLQID